jgi:hypothetical protein
VGALSLTGNAEALTFCAGVVAPDCSATYPATGDGLQQALSASDTNVSIDGSANVVRIGPGTFTRTGAKGFEVGGPVTVTGQGAATVLTSSPTPNGGGGVGDGFTATAGPSTLSNLVFRLTGYAFAVVSGFSNVSNVRVTGSADHYYGFSIPGGGRGTRLVVDPVSTPALQGGVLMKSAAVLEDSVIGVLGAKHAGVSVGDVPGGTTQPATVRHVTIAGNGADAGTVGVAIDVPQGFMSARAATVLVRDSIIRGVAIPFHREGQAASMASGTANVSVRYSSFNTATSARVEIGPGTFTLGPGNLNDPDPRFADLPGGDLRLRVGSPLIDAGDPVAPEAGDSLTDLAGAQRIVNGRRDIGAFEGGVTPAGSGAPTVGFDFTAPALGAVRLARTTFRVGPHQTPVTPAKHRAAKGTTIAFTLSEPASVTFAVERRLAGRLVKKRGSKGRVCRRQSRANGKRSNRRCTILRSVGSFSRAAAAGTNGVAFSGRIGRRRLSPGSYRLTITAKDAAGNVSKPKSIRFRIVR